MAKISITAFVSGLWLVAHPASAESDLTPLPDLTAENIVEQVQRCSAFYAAFRLLVSEELLTTEDPIEMARLQDLRDRTEHNTDAMLQASVILLMELEQKTKAEAVNIAVDTHDGMTTQYVRSLDSTGGTISAILGNDLWKNDTASCGALASNIGPLLESITEQ